MKFLEFISTERKKYLEKDECVELLKENCLKSIRNRSIFYRGFKSDSSYDYMLMSGSKGVRNSAMGNNNLLIYTNELYKDDPLYQDRSNNIEHLIDKERPIESFKKIFNKNVIDIKSVKSTNFFSTKMHEVWTEGKCIAIKEDAFYDILKELKKDD